MASTKLALEIPASSLNQLEKREEHIAIELYSTPFPSEKIKPNLANTSAFIQAVGELKTLDLNNFTDYLIPSKENVEFLSKN